MKVVQTGAAGRTRTAPNPSPLALLAQACHKIGVPGQTEGGGKGMANPTPVSAGTPAAPQQIPQGKIITVPGIPGHFIQVRIFFNPMRKSSAYPTTQLLNLFSLSGQASATTHDMRQ